MMHSAGYPKAKYSRTHPVCLVHSAEEEKKLPGEWFDNPNDVHQPKAWFDVKDATSTKKKDPHGLPKS